MSNDIAARLRDIDGGYGFRAICREAADEIERLRLEMSIPRDEYAMTWKNLLDRIDGLDIVGWIRAYANAYSPSNYSSPTAREVVVRSDRRWLEAADEIERLRAEVKLLRAGGCARGQTTTQFCAEAERLRSERDEARRRYCFAMAEHGEEAEARQTAKEEGWDCYRGASDADR